MKTRNGRIWRLGLAIMLCFSLLRVLTMRTVAAGTYEVRYYENRGDSVPYYIETCEAGTEVYAQNFGFDLPGYEQIGYESPQIPGFGFWSFTMPDCDVDLYPHWAPNAFFQVVYNAMGGIDAPDDSRTFAAYSAYRVLDGIPIRLGYSFAGWLACGPGDWAYNDMVFYGWDYFTLPAADVILEAQWEQNYYSVTYDLDGGSGVFEDTNSYVYSESISILPGAPTRGTDDFIGWLYGGNTYVAGDTLIMPAAHIVLVAQWQNKVPGSYTLLVNDSYAFSNGEGLYPEGTIVNIDAGTRAGYRFVSWSVLSENVILTRNNEAETSFVMPAADVIIKANWAALPKAPNTGDSTNMVYLIVGTLSLFAAGLTVSKGKKKS